MHSLLPFFLIMIVVIILLNMLATKLKVAYPILLVMAGLGVSIIPGLPVVKIDPDLIFFIFLPPLLFEASWTISFKEMKKWYRIITSFAFVVVFFTALTVALVSNYFIPGFSIVLGLLLGGIVSPPDAVSTGAITKFVKIPKSTSTILEGESLLNDASSLIIFRFALIAIGTGQFIWTEALGSFLWMVLGGTLMGIILAWIFVQIHKRLPTDAPSDIIITLIEPYIMYWIAEKAHSSGVLCVVAGGLYLSKNRFVFLNSSSRIKGYSVWESFVFILNGVVFLLIGLELPEIVKGIRSTGLSLEAAIWYGVLVTVTIIATRILCSYAALIMTLVFRPQVFKMNSMATLSDRKRQWIMPAILGWTGMRGVVSLAAALSIPVALHDGSPFPHRDLILFVTFVTILLTLVLQGLTLPYFIKKAKLFDEELNREEENSIHQKIKSELSKQVSLYIQNNYQENIDNDHNLKTLFAHVQSKTKVTDDQWMNEEGKAIYLEIIEFQRKYLLNLNKQSEIDEEIIRRKLYQFDLEEERLKTI
ncbi:Na+/H+ antiporter [Chryseobacterium culicis]|uniref:Sodium/proton antiporter, CPA1 family n=1 Tax=Chryseobacterium culicis TaxID=680127 RepID=A0A1H6ILQ0_CHRCI|nr:Na+/H+ antiporter [Chryseobacterium culicis]SEH47902.1 sodium/proton antiporter, CPA1 family [Chryseobacterium culicis]